MHNLKHATFLCLIYFCLQTHALDLTHLTENATVTARFATECITPNGERGMCLELAKCPIFAKENITPQHSAYDFFKASNCTPRNAKFIKVCCGSKLNFNSQIPKQQHNIEEEFSATYPLPSNCGKQKLLSFSQRIFGGVNAAIGEFPWMGRLIHRDSHGAVSYGCSAFLIHERFALTAAHCMNEKLLRILGPIFEIVLGDHDSSTEIDCSDRAKKRCAPQPQKHRVTKPMVYTGYDTTTGNHNNDIALIQLQTPAEFTNFVAPICLMHKPSEIDLFTVSGWGRTETLEESNIKMKLDLDRFPLNQCVNVYKKRGVLLKKKNQLCAGGLKNKDTCTGDSGGPLMVESNNTWYAEGIVSFGIGCGQEGVPGVYTNIPTYVPWIKKAIVKRLTQAKNKLIKKTRNPQDLRM